MSRSASCSTAIRGDGNSKTRQPRAKEITSTIGGPSPAVVDAHLRRLARIYGVRLSQLLREMSHRYWCNMDGTEGDGPVPVVAQTLELTEFKTKTDAKACAQRFDAYAAQARREGKTKDEFRAVVVGKRIEIDYDYGDGEGQPG